MKKTLCILTALLPVLTMSISLFGCGASADTPDDAMEYAKSKVQSYADSQARYNAEFFDEIYSKANLAALCFNPERTGEELESIAVNLDAESLTVTDGEGKIIADYPEKNKGKMLDDFKELVKFKSILKWVCPRCTTNIEKSDGEYALKAGVQRADDMGVVIVKLKTDSYSKVDGSKLADECGANVIVADDEKVLSATMEGVEAGKSLKELGIDASDISSGSFDLTCGGGSFSCLAENVENFTVICGSVKS